MDRLSRFRRGKKDSPTATPTGTIDDNSSGSRTPSPGAQALAPPPSRPRDKHSRSPFRNLHLRSSTKRAREASPASSLSHSPPAAGAHPHDDRKAHVSSPLTAANKQDALDEAGRKGEPRAQMPAFLSLSSHEVEAKFQELVWLERNRIMQSISNPSPEFRFARVDSTPQIKNLDRYLNVQPWQHNRVKLKVPEGEVDYINASPITLTTGAPSHKARPPDRYIAMQGPKKVSTGHAWRMVVEQLRSPAVIVMLTETHEAMTEKCFPYFPRKVDSPPLEINEHDEFGDGFRASVRCEAIEETPAGGAIELRKLVVRVYKKQPQATNGMNGHAVAPTTGMESNSSRAATEEDDDDEDIDDYVKIPRKDEDLDVIMKSPVTADHETPTYPQDDDDIEEERIVYHLLYKKWPDFGVPALEDLDSFFTLMRISQAKNADAANPRIVHCSAGVGRSGTFIALEHLWRELDAGVLEHYDDHRKAQRNSGADQDEGLGLSEAEGEDLIFTTVNQLREQRRTMVQAEAQYQFLYQVLRKLWRDKYGGGEDGGEPAAKRLEVDPFVEEDEDEELR